MQPLTKDTWGSCLTFLEERIKKESFYTWLKPTVAVEASDEVLTIGVPNKFVADWIEDRYGEEIDSALASLTGRACSHRLVIRANLPPENSSGVHKEREHVAAKALPGAPVLRDPGPRVFPPERLVANARAAAMLNPRYTFESFVVGESNQLAHAGSQAVSEKPGKTRFNPMFIYGTVGLGKTHLAQAIGNGLLDANPNAKVLYVTSEKFTNDFIFSLAKGTTAEFTERYRSLDVLLIDDIQFLAGKESTQVQFFHTFNTLHQNGKQIVLTADRPPRDIKGLEERLLSRFQWGLTVDIRPPDYETRVAILRKKLEGEKISVPDDALSYIARAAQSNIRELEGALIRLLAISSLEGARITLETAQHVLRDTLSPHRNPITLPSIINTVSQLFSVPPAQLVSKKRTQEIALGRQVAMYLARSLTNLSLKSIGAEFGGRDHSTVIHAVSVVREAMAKDPELKLRVDQAVASLYGGNGFARA
ncbi:MAG: chromosomal replication initiator protein DnaA [candidate division Zixibacteria bacterium]|nr:chromosomal replication initiator protein DnaA [candidate division Zixibacteria bacterium]